MADMMREEHGDLLRADVDALVNTVNTVGVMGKGIALQFKRAFPANYKAYKQACDRGELRLGEMFVWDAGEFAQSNPRYIINFPTKKHWKSRSKLQDIESGLSALVWTIRELGIRSVAVPPLGCGNGGLDWEDVKPVIERAFGTLDDVEVLVFAPEGAPAPADQIVRTERPTMTRAKAVVMAIMDRFLPYALAVTAVDIQKLMYFMQEAGEPLSLRYSKGTYGPYADNLRHLLSGMEGHYISGTGDQSWKALDELPFEILPGAMAEAVLELQSASDALARIDSVANVMEGFETTYGLELLATVHWAATKEKVGMSGDTPVESVASIVRAWNRRKGKLFTDRHVGIALEHLQGLGWLADGDDAQLPLPVR